jgi:hypothetical protein
MIKATKEISMRLIAILLAITIIALAPLAIAAPAPVKHKKALSKRPKQYACIRITDDREPILYVEML